MSNDLFRVGDRVRIILAGCDDNECGPHWGMVGVIRNLAGDGYSVKRDDRGPNQPLIHYEDSCLEPEISFHQMREPDFGLDEIAIAEAIINEAT